MTCVELETLLCDYVDDTLPAETRAAVEAHLDGCTNCAELARDAAAAVQFFASVPPAEPPDELVTRLLFQIPSRGQRRRGKLREFLGRWMRPVLQPRFAMGMAMTILSFSLLGRAIGLPDQPLRPEDLHPARVWAAVDDRVHRTWDRVVKYYDNLRVVIEIQNRLREWTADQRDAAGEVPSSGEPEERTESQ